MWPKIKQSKTQPHKHKFFSDHSENFCDNTGALFCIYTVSPASPACIVANISQFLVIFCRKMQHSKPKQITFEQVELYIYSVAQKRAWLCLCKFPTRLDILIEPPAHCLVTNFQKFPRPRIIRRPSRQTNVFGFQTAPVKFQRQGRGLYCQDFSKWSATKLLRYKRRKAFFCWNCHVDMTFIQVPPSFVHPQKGSPQGWHI